MKIRNRITLWISGAGFLAGLLFSVFITIEMIEQPYELLDAELESQVYTLLAGLFPTGVPQAPRTDTTMLNALGQLYWFKVFDDQQKIIHSSAMAKMLVLPLREAGSRYNISTTVPDAAVFIEQNENNTITFRVRVFTIPVAGRNYLVQIARPMEKLHEEIVDLIVSVMIALLLYTIVLLLAGYFAAGKILQPVTEINELALEISENTLDKRIPLGNNRDELYTLSASLNRMFDRLQFSFRQQKEFIANASHELKTPIAMLRLFFNEASQRTDIADDFRDKLERQTRTLYRMDRLVRNLLDLSALELNRSFIPREIDVTELVKSVLQEYKESIEAANIRLHTDIQKQISMQGDGERIRRILINLLDNAIKYNSGTEKEIRICLTVDGDFAHLEISNSCRGIPEDELSRVFDQFHRVEKSRATALGGSGLGLTIVKQIVMLHHGSIDISSDHHCQVSVHVHLPLKHQTDVVWKE